MIARIFHILLGIFISANSINAQTMVGIPLNPDTTKTLNIIPPLEAFIESAVNSSPILKASDEEIAQTLEGIKKQKKSWTDFVTIDGNTRYGLYNTVAFTDISGSTSSSSTGINASKQQLNYFGGLTMRVPLSAFFTQKNQIKILEHNIEETKYRKEQLKNDLIQLVVDEYFKLRKMERTVEITQNVLQSVRLDFLKAEKDIESGLITLGEYNHTLEGKGKIEESYNTAINEYMAQYQKIQILTGLKLTERK